MILEIHYICQCDFFYFVHCGRSRQVNLNVYVTALQEEVQEW